MPITPQNPLANPVVITEYPQQFPQIPEAVLLKNPELRGWQNDVDVFWRDFRYCLSREREALLNEINKLKD